MAIQQNKCFDVHVSNSYHLSVLDVYAYLYIYTILKIISIFGYIIPTTYQHSLNVLFLKF